MTALSPTVYQSRIQAWQKTLSEQIVSLLSNPADIEYFTGFQFLLPAEREAFLTIDGTEAILWYASFSPLPAQLALTAKPMYGFGTVVDFLTAVAEKNPTQKIEFDAANLTVAEHLRLQKISGIELSSVDREAIFKLRRTKDLAEVVALKKAAQITREAIAFAITTIKPGQTELDVAWLLEKKARELGAEGLAFPTIVAFGTHTALPHHQPTRHVLAPEMPVLLDFGARVDGYCGDMTRSFWFGEHASEEFKTIKNLVDAAYDAAVAWIKNTRVAKTPLLASDIDAQARQIITKGGFGDQFIHTTGHGIGLEVHEPPSLSWRNQSEVMVGTCFTVEPGIYVIDQCGYRFENTLLLTETGVQILTTND